MHDTYLSSFSALVSFFPVALSSATTSLDTAASRFSEILCRRREKTQVLIRATSKILANRQRVQITHQGCSLVFDGYFGLPIRKGDQPSVENGEGSKQDSIGDQIHHLDTPEQPCVSMQEWKSTYQQ